MTRTDHLIKCPFLGSNIDHLHFTFLAVNLLDTCIEKHFAWKMLQDFLPVTLATLDARAPLVVAAQAQKSMILKKPYQCYRREIAYFIQWRRPDG